MNLLASYLQGAALGLVLAVQVGPISLLCVRQALGHGLGAGVAVGVGATLADFLYASIAALGLGGVGRSLASWTGAMQAVGGVLLVTYGYRGWRARRQPMAEARPQAGRRAFAASFLLTLTNPLTILFFASVLAGLGVAGQGPAAGLAVASGLATTTLLWMAGLALLADRAGRWLSPARLRVVNGAASLLLAALGAGLVVRAVT
ncbi:MAG: LysE family transporter [Opitutaceae bacterium]|nr:LysE family transporter [Opitutaceae bacterium]